MKKLLFENPACEITDTECLLREHAMFYDLTKASNEEADALKTLIEMSKRDVYHGPISWLRLCYFLLEELVLCAYRNAHNLKNKVDADGCNSDSTPKIFAEIRANKLNEDYFKSCSKAYPEWHDDFQISLLCLMSRTTSCDWCTSAKSPSS